MGKLGYLVRSLAGLLAPRRQSCPNCGGSGRTIARRYGVTALKRCGTCELQYRTPTDPPSLLEQFYEDDYAQGRTTALPSLEELERMKASGFAAELENDYVDFARMLKALGAKPGARVFDFGCSWGYGSYLLREAGFEVKSFEISRSRRSFGERHLGIDLTKDFDAFVAQNPGTFDVFFSSHVLEHVPAPGAAIEKGLALLRPGGLLVSVFPNGSQAYRQANPWSWRKLWGEVHPNFLDDVFLARCLGGLPYLLGSPPIRVREEDLRHLEEGTGERRLDTLDWYELLVAARKPAA